MTNLLITPEEISLLARPCHVDEQKAIAYIVEAELNNIKPALGDDLFLRLKRGENRLLLEGGEYERDGKLYYIAGVKRALAYYVYSRLLESGSVDLTRQGVVNRRSEFSDEADEREKISVSRETYTIADRYMQEIAQYIGGCGEATETSQRTRMKLIGGSGGDSRKYHSTTPSGNISPSSPSSNINVVQTLGDSTKDVISQAGVTREFNALREEIKDIEVPSLDGYATETYVQQQIGNINEVLTSIING